MPSKISNITASDAKLGNTTDFAAHKTLLGYQNSLYQHVHNQAKVYPTLADGITVEGGVGAWTLGNFVEIIPANTITTQFDIHWINFESASATDIYEFVLYSGAAASEVEIGRIRSHKETAKSGTSNIPIQIPAQLANARISAKLASNTGGDNVVISVFYHIYT